MINAMKSKTGLIFVLSITLLLVLAVYVGLSQQPAKRTVSMPAVPAPAPTHKPGIVSWPSPDGTQFLTMKTTFEKSGQKTFSFSVHAVNVTSETFIFSKTVGSTVSMAIPFNSWSPDDKHFFVTENDSGDQHNLIANASGKPFPSGELVEDLNAAFVDKKTPFPFEAATGWAAPTLIVVNTKAPNSTLPISYWFDINRKVFIRLSTSFQ